MVLVRRIDASLKQLPLLNSGLSSLKDETCDRANTVAFVVDMCMCMHGYYSGAQKSWTGPNHPKTTQKHKHY